MARRSQCSSVGDNPLDPNYLPPHYREEYRLAIDALIEEDLEGYYQFLQKADVVDFLSSPELEYIQSSVQVPQQSNNFEQYLPEAGGDGSSDTYWPIHSDLDAPGLDLGWPELHHFIGPTEVTTLVNPPEPDMPSIKEQARRLIKNARQVIAIVMDMFTDVDMLADILNAAMRNVAVYIILDKQNAHHFVNMLSNCRVSLQSIQLLRVRTVSGNTYHCRSGKSFKGQMMDRFLLTDCRAVLSGNYSFMWSYEKLHRCMAHLFLGQLVSTFDEEFRILFAQSQPLMIEDFTPIDELSILQKRKYPSERTTHREPKKFQSLDTRHREEGPRHSYDERMDMDWRMMAHKKQESLHGPADMHSRFTPQQSRMDPNLTKRHSYAEGTHGRYSSPFLQQQGMPEPENQGRQFHRGQHPGPGPGREADNSGYDKFWNQDFYSADQYSEPGLSQEIVPSDNFDPVLNYLSSTRKADFDQGSEKSAADSPFDSPRPRRSSLGQLHACKTSPTPSNPTDQKQSFQEPNADRKDPSVKRGLRNWRIRSYLSTYDNPGEEGLPSAPPNAQDPFEEPSNPIQQTPGIDLSVHKIPNVREFKIPAIPRASQMPSYTTAREQPKKLPDEHTGVAAETNTTPTPSESSSTTEVDKIEEAGQKEPKTSGLRREESFRRKYNAALPRSSRLRSSLIFSSLEQHHTSQDTKTAPGQLDEEGDKSEAEPTKQPYSSQVLGQRRSAREPFEWSRYMKSATFDNSATDSSKPDDTDSPKDENSKDLSEVQKALKPPDIKQADSSPSMPRSKASEVELPKTDQPVQPTKPFLTTPLCVDMCDPDQRLNFFKELAAKRKATMAAEAENSKGKAGMKQPAELKNNTTVKKEEPVPKETSEKMADASTSEGLLEKNATAEDGGKTVSTEALDASKSCKQQQTGVSTDSEKIELKNSQSAATLPVSAETAAPQSKTPEEPKLSNPAVKTSSRSHPPTPTNATPATVRSPAHGTDESESPCLDSTLKESISLTPSSVTVPPSSELAALDSNTTNPESVQLETRISSNPSGQSSSSDHSLPNSGSHISPSSLPSSCALLSTSAESISSSVTPEDSSSTLTSSILSPNAQESVSPSPPEPSKLTSSETLSAVDSAHQLESNTSHDTCAAGSETNTSSLQPCTKTDSEKSCPPTPSEKDVPESENNSVPKGVGEKSGVFGSSKNVKADGTLPSLSPSLPESCLPNVSELESKSRSAQKETITDTPSPAETPPKHSPSETSSPVHPDLTPNASQSNREATPPSDPTPPETVSYSSPLTESVGSVLSPEAEKTLAKGVGEKSEVLGSSNDVKADGTLPRLSPSLPESCLPNVSDLESHPSEPPVPAEDSNGDSQNGVSKEPEMTDPVKKETDHTEAANKVNKNTTQETVCDENENEQVKQKNCSEPAEITSEEVVPPSPQSKQPKSSQSRYQTSTANVLSSSNLRDDTKLLLEQISANSQSRNEAAKESPVTDDEKEDEADKNAKREKERGIRSLTRGQPKTDEERDKLLEKIQHMRKERKVYSRFEMAP